MVRLIKGLRATHGTELLNEGPDMNIEVSKDYETKVEI